MVKLNLKRRALIGVILNFLIFLITVFAMFWQIAFRGNTGPLGDFGSGFSSLLTFTNESNILCALISLFLAFIGINNLIKKDYNFSHSFKVLQLIGATVVLLTFTVVLIFLTPFYATKTGNLFALFSDSMFFTHFLTPLLAALTFVFFTPNESKITLRDNFLILIPIILYGIIYLINVVFLKTWPDFYNFTLGGHLEFIPLVFIIILAASFGLARLLIITEKKTNS